MTRRLALRALAFWLLVALVAAAHVLVAWSSLTLAPLWEDEAFNLTVPVNLLQGLGYSSDGTLSGSTLTPFDPRISTGPAVLLPVAGVLATGADLIVGGRVVPLLYTVALLVALWLLGSRVGGRWGALVAIAVPLAFDASGSVSPIQGPADILGELPAAALLAWALVTLRRRPWLAGLLIGCAIQAKYISFLAVPAFVVALLVVQRAVPWATRLRTLVVPAVLVIVPTAVVEFAALVSLGPAGFGQHLLRTGGFLLSGGQSGSHTTLVEKLLTLAGAWRLPGPLVIGLSLMLIAVGAWALAVAVRRPDVCRTVLGAAGLGPARDVLRLLLVAAIGVATFVAWWAAASHTPLWVRHPAPGVVAFVPVLAAFVVLAVRMLWASRPAGRPGAAVVRATAATAAAVLAVTLGAQTSLAVAAAAGRDAAVIDAQRAVAGDVATLDADSLVTVWGPPVSIVVLSGAHVGLTDAPPENIVGRLRLLTAGQLTECSEPLLEAGGYLVCAPLP